MREFPVLNTTSEWIEETLASMTLEQKIGQLLHPNISPTESPEALDQFLGDVEPGGMFLHPGNEAAFKDTTRWLQDRSRVPLLISSDLESGAGHMVEDATIFPNLMSLAATDDEEYAFEMGRATAIEGRACGVHWSFAPVVDINGNPFTPGPNTSGLGDDPERIARLSKALIRGMQQNGLCATAKHFPDGGFDDRDPHICTTINPLRLDEWFALSGRLYQEAIDLGVWSIMIGHTSLPAWDAGDGTHIQNAPPAPISRRIITGLLRERMGFQGLIITDAMQMAGVTTWGPFDEIMPAAVEAGCDMLLFASPQRDFENLKRAVEQGRITKARIDESARRILALKETLGLHQDLNLKPVAPLDRERFEHVSKRIAEKAVSLERDHEGVLPLTLETDTRVLSYHLRSIAAERQVDAFDDLLRARGVDVTHIDETELGKVHEVGDLSDFDVVLINAVYAPSWGVNTVRPGGAYMRDVWALIESHHPRLVLVSYGSPFLLYEMPNLPLVINAYSPDLNTQKAVLRVLTGEIEATGKSPVDLDAPYRLKSMEALRYARKTNWQFVQLNQDSVA